MLAFLEKILNVLGEVDLPVVDILDDIILIKFIARELDANALSVSVIFVAYGLDTVLGAIGAHEQPITADEASEARIKQDRNQFKY